MLTNDKNSQEKKEIKCYKYMLMPELYEKYPRLYMLLA